MCLNMRTDRVHVDLRMKMTAADASGITATGWIRMSKSLAAGSIYFNTNQICRDLTLAFNLNSRFDCHCTCSSQSPWVYTSTLIRKISQNSQHRNVAVSLRFQFLVLLLVYWPLKVLYTADRIHPIHTLMVGAPTHSANPPIIGTSHSCTFLMAHNQEHFGVMYLPKDTSPSVSCGSNHQPSD